MLRVEELQLPLLTTQAVTKQVRRKILVVLYLQSVEGERGWRPIGQEVELQRSAAVRVELLTLARVWLCIFWATSLAPSPSPR